MLSYSLSTPQPFQYIFIYLLLYSVSLYLIVGYLITSNKVSNFDNASSFSPITYLVIFLLVGLPPMPSFFVKVGILFFVFSNFSFTAFLSLLVTFMVLWAAAFFFIYTSISSVRPRGDRGSSPHAYVSILLIFVISLSVFFIDLFSISLLLSF